MNRLSLVSRRLDQCKKTSLFLQSVRSSTSFEPYHHNLTGMFADIKRMDGGRFGGRGKQWTYHWKFIAQLYLNFVLMFYCMRQYLEYENIFTWGKEEALAQMNYRSMRDEELIYLWVRYNQLKTGQCSEDEVYRPPVIEDYGWDNIY